MQKNIIIEATFFRAIAKLMRSDNIKLAKYTDLENSLSVIDKNYDTTMENKEKVLKKISDFLFKVTFPKGKISCLAKDYNSKFYGVMVAFTNKLEELSKTYNDKYIHELISKHEQIVMIFNSKKEEMFNKICFVWIAVFIFRTISSLLDENKNTGIWLFNTFIFGIFPVFMIKSIKNIKNTKK